MTPESIQVQADAQPPRKRIALVAMGNTSHEYVKIATTKGRRRMFEEVWALNAMGGVIDCDRVIMMDTPYDLLSRADEYESLQAYPDWWKTVQVPVYTSDPDPVLCPTSVQYPLDEVLKVLPYAYFNNTVPYAVALAIAEGATEVWLFGCDFTYPNSNLSESGRGCTEFHIAMGMQKGVQFVIAAGSTLLDTHTTEKFYGFGSRVRIEETGVVRIDPPKLRYTPDASVVLDPKTKVVMAEAKVTEVPSLPFLKEAAE